MITMKLLADKLRKLADSIEDGTCYLSEEELLEQFDSIMGKVHSNISMSKEMSCSYLHISRPTFDRLVKDGKLPKGKPEKGFKELVWHKKDLDDYKHLLQDAQMRTKHT